MPIGRAFSPTRAMLRRTTCRMRVDHRDGVAVFAGHVGLGSIGQEGGGPRPGRGRELADEGRLRGVDREHLAVFLRGGVHHGAVGAKLDAFRLAAHLHGRDHLAVGDGDDTDRGRILVGHEQPPAVLADRELLGVGAHRHHLEEAKRAHVHHPDAVGGSIRRRQGLLVHPGRGVGRATERYVQGGAVGAQADAAGPLAQPHRSHDLLRTQVDDAQVAGALVGDVEAPGGTGVAPRNRAGDDRGRERRARRRRWPAALEPTRSYASACRAKAKHFFTSSTGVPGPCTRTRCGQGWATVRS